MGASGDTSNIMSVLGLKYDGSKYVQTISASVLSKFQLDQFNSAAVGSDSLTINGVSIGTFSGTDTLGSVISRINSSSAGVTATIDPDSQRLRLTANTLGSTAITVSDSASGTGLVSKLGLGNAPTLGAGVVFQITPPDGTPISGSSNSNMIDFSAYGFGGTSMSVTGTGTFNVQVSASAGDYKSKINSLISAYNNLKQMVEASTKITVDASGKVSASVFSNRSDINTLLSSIRSKVYTAVEDPSVSSGATNASYSGLSASYNTMGKIGIGFDSNGQMVISDSAKLDSVLATNPGAVDALLNSGNGGISLDIIAGAPPSSNQIAVTNPNLKVGQAISAAWLPSGTKITAVSGGAGTYTVTLSNAILGTYDGAGAKYTPPTSAMGVGVRLSTFLSNLTGTSGLVATATSSLTGQVKRLQNQIDALDRSLALKEKQLTNSFIAMESAQSKFQNMSSQITAAFK